MIRHLCATCGTQYPESSGPPASCSICEDDRQYVPGGTQSWTTLEELRRTHRGRLDPLEPGLHGIGMEPWFGIGQRALLLQTSEGNVLWDCIPFLDDDLARRIRALGGIDAIAISHPHYYATMVEWAHAFDAPVHLHEADREWVVRPDPALSLWSGERKELFGGLTLHRLGGHFPGSAVLHWPRGADGRGVLLSGDTLHVVPDHGWVALMHSYPNFIPLPAREVERIGAVVEPLVFDRVYGAWWDRVIEQGAKGAVRRSVARYAARSA